MGVELILKAALVPLSMLLSSLAARRFGHGFAGMLSGFPLIAGPVMLMLSLQLSAPALEAITTATLLSLPATVAFSVTWAWLARRFSWWFCLGGGIVAFVVLGLLIHAITPWVHESNWRLLCFSVLLPLVVPTIGFWLMPPAPAGTHGPKAGVSIPTSEIVVRMMVAFLMGVLLIAGAGRVPPALSGLLMTWPVTGTVLPSFTLALHGREAAIVLLRGSVRGLLAFALFFLAMRLGLVLGLPPLGGFLTGVSAPLFYALFMRRGDRLDRSRQPSVPEDRKSSAEVVRPSDTSR